MNKFSMKLFLTSLALLAVNGQFLGIGLEFGMHVSTATASTSGAPHIMSLYWQGMIYQCSVTPRIADTWYMCNPNDATTLECEGNGDFALQVDNTGTNDVHIDQIKIESIDLETGNVVSGIYATVPNGGNYIGTRNDPDTGIPPSQSRLYHFEEIVGGEPDQYWAIRDVDHEINEGTTPECITYSPTPQPTAATIAPTSSPVTDTICVSNGELGYRNLNGEYVAVATGTYMDGSGPLNPLYSFDSCNQGQCNIYKMSLCNGYDYYFGVWAERYVITTSPPPPENFWSWSFAEQDEYMDIIFYFEPTVTLTPSSGEWGSNGFMSITVTEGPCL